MFKLALQLIREAKEKRATFLDLGNCGLTDLPEELFELNWLKELNLGKYFYDSESKEFKLSQNKGPLNTIRIPENINNLKKIKALHLSDQITDISFLQGLINLTLLNLSGNKITNVNLLAGLTNLTWLNLSSSGISSIGFLKGLTNLTSLYLSNPTSNPLLWSRISDYSPLKGLTNLTSLSLAGCKINQTDISFLQRFINLTSLNLSNNSISDISFLQGLTNLTSLYLSRNRITDYNCLKGLTNLTSLDLSSPDTYNLIADLAVLKKLTNLTSLGLSGTKVTEYGFLQELANLTSLNLSYNEITDHSFLQELTNLTSLDLSSNKINNISFLKELTNLTSLDLSHNEITDIRFLQGLTNLTSLVLMHNRITDITPIKYHIEKGISIKDWGGYDFGIGIFLSDNPITTPPPEIIQQGNEAVLNYFKELEQHGAEYLYEAKLLIIGEGGAGKTSLAKKLKDELAPLPEENDTTEGISIEPYAFKTASGKNFQINIWDFGGQEIYHATHQFFLTKRSLYILVDDTRKDDKTANDASFNYWLQVVGLFGGGSPLLIVQNEKSDRTKKLDMKGMQGRFDFIKENLSTNLFTCRGLKEVREEIHHHIQKLPHVGEKLPKKWIAVRKALDETAKTRDFISLGDYFSICAQYDIKDEERAIYLSSFLHDLGFFLHFQDDTALQNTVILNNQWGTDAVYKLLDNEAIKRKYGHFNKADLSAIWLDAKYKYSYKELLALMMRFELCYALRDSTDSWLAPQLLPVEAPNIPWDYSNNLVISYSYVEFMPKGILSRFIVRMNQYLKEPSLSWRSGVVLERQNTKALVTEIYGSREIVIRVKGSHSKELMTLIAEDFDTMRSRFENLKVEKLIPCNCQKCASNEKKGEFNYDRLIIAKENGIRQVQCTESFKMVNVQELLDGMFTDMKKKNNKMLRVFLSYSHSDEKLKEELDKSLSALKRSEKISTWNDREITGGEEWDTSIKQQLDEADIILLLISRDFLESNYIWEVEIKRAIERHNHNEVRVIPIFLRACDFEGMPFAKLQGYPKDAKPVTSFSEREQDEVFTQIAKGIRSVIENWTKF